MKKIIVGILAILVIGTMSLQVGTPVVSAATTSSLKNKQSENNKKINEAQDNLEEVKVEKSETIKEVESLSTKITDFQTQIQEIDGKITDLKNKITDSEQKLNKAEEEYKEQEKLLESRLVTMQEAGETSYIDFLLSSENITDLISNFYLLSELTTNDSELLDKIQTKKEEINNAKNELESSKKELDTSKASKQSVTTQLQATKDEKNKHVDKLSGDEKQIQEEIEELQTANIKINQEIKAAQQRYAAQIAALNNSSNNGNSGNSKAGGNNKSSGGGSTYTGGGNGTLQRPVSSGSITAGMYYPSGSYHGALDYGVPCGTPVYAAATGVVITTANLSGSYGTYVVIQHANGLQTLYAHGTRGSICVSPGQTVSRGQQIMLSGNTGRSSGPHLHFEVRVAPGGYNNRVDPRNYF